MDEQELDEESLYLILAREVYCDDHVGDQEKSALKAVQQLLRLPPARIEALDELARTQSQPGLSSLDPERVFRQACERAWNDGRIKKGEVSLLLSLAQLLEIPESVSDRIFEAAKIRSRRVTPTSPAPFESSDPDLKMRPAKIPAAAARPRLPDLVPTFLVIGVLLISIFIALR